MVHPEQQTLLDNMLATLEDGTLVLPALPDMAVKILNLIDDPNVSTDQMIRVISGDPVISAQLMKIANSASYADKSQVTNLNGAVSRLGFRMLRNLVLNFSMAKSFHSKNPAINKQLQVSLARSREVSVISYVLAQQHKHLKPDQAMLAGLMHNIGVLPLCMFIEQNYPEMAEETINNSIQKFHWQLGSRLLQAWNFPSEFIDMVKGHENLQRDSGSYLADYTDIVTVANMQKRPALKVTAWENIVAVKKLGMTQEECRNFLDKFADKLSVAGSMLDPARN